MHYQNKPHFSLLTFFLFAAIVLSCSEKDKVDPNSAGFFISESEKAILPENVSLPAGNTRVATLYAKGYQIYRAQQVTGSNPATYEWVFVAPIADLYDEKNNKVGAHFAGPTWQLEKDNSRINGQAFNPAKASSVQGAIDLLLLMPKAGTTPTGIFDGVDYIQRIATTGGRAPSTPPTGLVGEIGVEYTAVYRFSKQN